MNTIIKERRMVATAKRGRVVIYGGTRANGKTYLQHLDNQISKRPEYFQKSI